MTILILSALLPVLLVLLYINYSDKHEKEPKKLLIVSFVLGAVLSVVLALIMYFGFDIILPLKDDFSIQQQIIKAFLVVGFTEILCPTEKGI